MNKFITSLFLCLAIFPLTAEVTNGVEYSLKTDERPWKIGHEFKSDKGSTTIFVLEQEDMNNRSESFIVSRYNPSEIMIATADFAQHFTTMMEKFLPGKRVGYKMISSNSHEVFLEWWALGQENISDEMHGWMRMLITGKGIVSLGYETKKMDQLEEARKIWPAILEKAKMID